MACCTVIRPVDRGHGKCQCDSAVAVSLDGAGGVAGVIWSDHGGNSQDLIIVTERSVDFYKVGR